MKRILTFLTSLLLLAACAPASLADGGAVSISTPEELLAMADDPDASYALAADLDMSGVEWTPFVFSGELDGGGHTIYNLCVTTTGEETAQSVDGNGRTYDTAFAGLFSILRDASVRDLGVVGAQVRIESDDNCFAGILAGCSEDSVIEGCSVEGRAELYTTGKNVGVGGLVGFGSGEILSCTADVTLIFADRSEKGRCEQFMGGVLSCGDATIDNCTVSIDGYDSCRGYVHNGGLVGMYYYIKFHDSPRGNVTRNYVQGQITFFENNPNRRAYCKSTIGEVLSHPEDMRWNTSDFVRNEIFTYNTELHPEKCEAPAYTDTVIAPGCTHWGYTVHTCDVCGCSYSDSYTPPAHSPGEPVAVRQPDYGQTGLEQITCTVCGELLEEGELPALVPCSSVLLTPDALAIHYKDTAVIQAELEPADTENTAVIWSSSDESVASVDEYGAVTAHARGSAVITCTSADGFAAGSCDVAVDYSFAQWLIVILLFGWIWY